MVLERNQHSGDVFDDNENDMEDVTTPLRLEEYSGFKLNTDNKLSVGHRGNSSTAVDDDAPHSPYRYIFNCSIEKKVLLYVNYEYLIHYFSA